MKRSIWKNHAVTLILTAAALAGTRSAAQPPAIAPPVERLAIVDRAIEHHGGARYENTETSLELCSKGGCFRVRARVDAGRFDLEVRGKAAEGERTVRIANDTVTRWLDGEPVAVPPDDEQRLRDWVMARVYFPFLPYRLDDPGVWKHDLGVETWAGRPLHRVKVTFTPDSSSDADDQYAYWLDPETGRVEQFAYTYSGSPGGLRFRRAVNHRRVGGILFFDQENYGAEGDALSVDDVTPEFAEQLEHVSTVTLRHIVVRNARPGTSARQSLPPTARSGTASSW